MTRKRRELSFQRHIIKSHKNQGGHAEKLANEWIAGLPDLVCSMPGFGMYMIEVKHKPEMGPNIRVHRDNPMTVKQIVMAKRFIEAGGTVFLGVVAGSSEARGSYFGLFNPLMDQIIVPRSGWSKYELGEGFDMIGLLDGVRR